MAIKWILRSMLLWSCGVMSLTGCASGGFKLTRQYASFVNSQNIIIRIVLYILTSVIFAITMLVDMVIFNTMDFWEGRVSQGTYDFSKGGKTYQAVHEIAPDNKLKRSTITVRDDSAKILQVVVLQETITGEIECLVDGQVRARVRDINSFPVASIFDAKGILTEERLVLGDGILADRKSVV